MPRDLLAPQSAQSTRRAPRDLLGGTERPSFREAQRQSATADRGALSASTLGGSQGATLSFGDELMAGAFTPLEMAIGAVTGEDAGKGFGERIGDAYGRGLDLQRAQLDAARENHPTAMTVGEVAGGVAAMTPGLGMAKTIPGRMAIGATENLAYGGISAFGAGEGFDDRLQKSETGAQIGAGLGAAIPGAGALAGAAVRGGKAVAAPFTQAGREGLAARRIEEAATDPASLREALNDPPAPIVPGSQPTTFQQTGDMGIGALERGAATRNADQFNQRRADQNEARVGAMRGIEAEGAPEKVAASVRQRIEALDAETDRLTAEATEHARGASGAAGSPMTPDVAGGNMRSALEEARGRAKEAERALWAAVDPDGTLALAASNARQQAIDTVRNFPASAKPASGEEAAIMSTLQQYPEGAVPFSEITAMSSRIKAELRAERMTNGETPAYARLSRLNAALQSDLDTAIAGKVARETEAVAAGRMDINETMMARFAAKRDGWFAEREAVARGADGGGGAGGYTASGSASVSGVPGAGGQARGRSGGPAGDPRLAGAELEPNFDAAARDRLNAANTATQQRAQTFDNDTLGPMRRRPATTAPYTMPAGAVPAQIFNGRPQSFEAIGQFRAAVGDRPALEALQGYAVGEIQRVAGRTDGTLDPARLNTWRRQHAQALRAMPELDARLADAGRASEAMAEVASARQAHRKATEAGAVGRILQVDDPESVTRVVGGIFSRQDAVEQMGRLRSTIGDDKEALQGLRRAVIEHMNGRFIGNTEAATSGIGTMRSDQLQTFVRQNAKALQAAGFSAGEMRVLDAIAADLQRANRSIAAVKLPGQSNTAQDTLQVGKDDTPLTAATKMFAAGGVTAMRAGATTMQGLAVASAGGFIAAARRLGLNKVDDIVTDALLNPERARILLSKAPASGPDRRWSDLARSYNRSATAALARQDNEGRRDQRGPMRLPERMPPQLGPRASALTDAVAARGGAMPTRAGPLVEALAARGM